MQHDILIIIVQIISMDLSSVFQEESQKILATGVDFMSSQTRSISDKPFLSFDALKVKICRICKLNVFYFICFMSLM